MIEEEARNSVSSIEQLWECDLRADLPAWLEALAPLDSTTVAGTLLKLYERSGDVPTIAEVVAAAREMETEKRSSLHTQAETPAPPVEDAERGAFVFDLAPWIKGWAVARYKHKDFRVFPQQGPAYDSLQLSNSGYRTYVWPEQEKMDPEDAARYIEEGAPLRVAEIFRMITA